MESARNALNEERSRNPTSGQNLGNTAINTDIFMCICASISVDGCKRVSHILLCKDACVCSYVYILCKQCVCMNSMCVYVCVYVCYAYMFMYDTCACMCVCVCVCVYVLQHATCMNSMYALYVCS